MRDFMQLFTLCCLLSLAGCNESGIKDDNDEPAAVRGIHCDMPREVEQYLTNNTERWSVVERNEFDSELLTYLSVAAQRENSVSCPYFIRGDFTDDGDEDYAVILQNIGSVADGPGGYKIPFLLIFNGDRDNADPYVVYRTEVYRNEERKTVIKTEVGDGILSYLSSGSVCDREVVIVNNFEKSSFFTYWDQQNGSYQVASYSDEELCEKVNPTKNEFSFYEENERYFITDIDVNNDNCLDKVVSSKPHQGDELLIF
ncbi:hypothetical protein [Halomonas sp. MMSF_3323]|uniref:hypothetical protein n=1 Tax=Halomonas sp. MMSF_3323 TaxID=3046701 RepID=UPI00273EB784|nr:hypothetical protein [Halomonas sp. MMSF_3323]